MESPPWKHSLRVVKIDCPPISYLHPVDWTLTVAEASPYLGELCVPHDSGDAGFRCSQACQSKSGMHASSV